MAVALNEKTTIPLWGLVVAIPTLCGAVLAFGFTSWQGFANARAVEKIEARLEKKDDKDEEQDKQILTLTGNVNSSLIEIKTTLRERKEKR